MTARTLEYRGTLLGDGGIEHELARSQLAELAAEYPVGRRVAHACGRQGTVVLDQPVHVPGLFNGKPTTVCLGGEFFDQPMVFVSWHNEYEFNWRVWAPVSLLLCTTTPAVNRPGNKAKVGGRR